MKSDVYYAVDLIGIRREAHCEGAYDTVEEAHNVIISKQYDVPKAQIRMVVKVDDEVVYNQVILQESFGNWQVLW